MTTVGAADSVHIAPIGVHVHDAQWVIAPFRPSMTLDNILATRTAVINYCDDVRVFAGCLTGRTEWPTLPALRVRGVRLAAALAHCEVVLERVEEDAQRPRLWCRTVHQANHAAFQGFNRAQAAVIEAAILVSRLHLLPADKVEREVRYLTTAVEKTAGPSEQEAWGWLLERIAAFRKLGQENV